MARVGTRTNQTGIRERYVESVLSYFGSESLVGSAFTNNGRSKHTAQRLLARSVDSRIQRERMVVSSFLVPDGVLAVDIVQ